jgi:hypothetical protein
LIAKAFIFPFPSPFLQVQQAGRDALDKIGSVIKNPEIQKMLPFLVSALNDPVKHTQVCVWRLWLFFVCCFFKKNNWQACLTALLETAFIHIIDPASLALIMVYFFLCKYGKMGCQINSCK